ncbi:protein ACCELERATED CELL DEATH 6-like [Phoenix dactylifera]|uniref:Protein ACCELERATED CELL DEATH 6-like n=1 Tax=Phoenix dactylifera TaxID=42345 RepID=A0A8B8ZPN9_PHODC|nr:protein ACCELERATED CELL DEATH 6-like [Phoenix dactylifera]
MAALGAYKVAETIAEESLTSQTVQTDSDLEVFSSEVQPGRIPMNPKLLQSARSGDKRILDELLRPGDFPSRASAGEIAITVPEDSPIQEDTSCLLGVTLEGNTVLHIVASRGHHEIAKEICCREISLLAAPNTRLDTPLHCAARAGDDKMVSLIIQFAREGEIEERRVLRAKNRDEANALHEAAKYNHASVAKVLMEEDSGLASMPNSVGMFPLYLAITSGSFDVAKALLQSSFWEKASPASYAGFNKKTALHVAVLLSREITEDILQRKPMLAKGVDSSGRIPLHYAASDGHHDMVKLLLERDPSTAYLADAKYGLFPIHIAAMMGNIPIVDQILKQCPDTDELLDKEGKNFLHAAFKRGKLDLVKRIISRRPDLRKLLNDQDNEGNTPLHTAVKNSDQRSVHFLLRNQTVCVNVINHDGFTPLDLAYRMLDDKGLQFWMNAKFCIAICLALTKALSSPRELHHLETGELSSDETKEKLSGDDKFKKESSNIEDKEIRRQVDLGKDYWIAAVLIATVTFAAGFTVPGGYIADDHPGRGTAVLAKDYAFKVFLVSDSTALGCSILATCWLLIAGTSMVDTHTRRIAHCGAISCLWVAFMGMSTAFAMAIYVVLPPSCKRIRIIFCIIALGAPFLVHMAAYYNAYVVLKTVRIRQGYRQCIYPTTHPHDVERLGPALLMWGARLIFWLLVTLGVDAIFFLFATL